MESSHTLVSNSDSDSNYATILSAPPKRRAGRTKFRETRHPIYKGVRRRGRGEGRWVCEVREPKKKSRIWLGTYATAEMAARAHDVAAIALRGRSACLNFADSAWRLPVPDSASPKAIRAAAAMAAEAFGPGKGLGLKEVAVASPSDEGEGVVEAVAAIEEGFDFEWLDYLGMGMQEGYYYESLAEGLLVDPPVLTGLDDVDFSADVDLWSYSY
ncbi:AP2/ERF domain-containing protein [Dioscorea alata]|uniref:AP2/ERF domain-containing protein n=1 Tax=Dioscorea alata TaxID=55571 RepID=A0ACB7WVD0_DIOAL|nr:AP2/ERF domain-containing protein [Dioscorea alata]